MSRHIRISGALVLLSLTLASCTQMRLTHFDDREFEPVIRADVSDTAWLVVDSCATGVHALLELELQPLTSQHTSDFALEPSRPLPITLEYGAGFSAMVRHGRMEGPICLKTASFNDERMGVPPYTNDTSCSYFYTAEFKLHHLPSQGQNFRIHVNGRSILLAQR